MTTGSSMQAMTLTGPPHFPHVSMSILPTGTVGKGREQDVVASKTRFKRCAHVIAMDGMYAGFAGAKTGHGYPRVTGI